jgi:hypothetical protein
MQISSKFNELKFIEKLASFLSWHLLSLEVKHTHTHTHTFPQDRYCRVHRKFQGRSSERLALSGSYYLRGKRKSILHSFSNQWVEPNGEILVFHPIFRYTF